MTTKKNNKTTKELKELSWVKRGKQRREILVHMKGIQTPTELAKESGYSLNHTSRILGEFKEHKLVTLLNPEDKTGRLYKLTNTGRTIKDLLQDDD